jgi:chlorobactene glucosyltransferase
MMFALFLISLLLLGLMAYNMTLWPGVAPGDRRHDAAASVSVLIPARDEEANIASAIERTLNQSMPAQEILVYNDHSTDRTEEIVQSLSMRDSRVRLIKPRALPEGWCGKTFACSRLAAEARGEWLLFIDADTILESDAVGRIVGEAERRSLTLLSCWPGLVLRGFWEKALMPMLNFVVFTLFPAPLSVTMKLPALGLAHGACILIRRAEYEETEGHSMVKGELFEDTALSRAWRAAGQRGLCLDGQEVVKVRMYDSLAGIWTGFQKNVYPAFKHELSFWLFWIFHFIFFVMPFILVIAQGFAGILSPMAAGMACAALLCRLLQAFRFGYSLWSVLLHPFSEIALLALALVSWYKCNKGTGVVWKGRSYRGGTI